MTAVQVSSPLTRPSERRSSERSAERLPLRWTRSAAAVLIIVAAGMFGYGEYAGWRSGTALLVLPIALPIAHIGIKKVAAAETRFDLVGVLWLGLGAKLVSTYLRLLGGVDAVVYDQEGARLATEFRALNLTPDIGRKVPGTGSIRYLTGVVHVFTNSSYGATFLVFALFGFIGVVYAYRAFVIAVPDGDHQRFALLVLFWPTLLFWPASIGKEAVMILGIGLACFGAARVIRMQHAGAAHVLLGLFAMGMVRPHVALIMLVAMFVALVLRRPGEGRSGGAAKAVTVVLLLLVGMVVVQWTEQVLQLESLASDAGSGIAQAEAQTSQGGGRFSAARVRTPLDYPKAVLTVLFRPFPWEVRSPLQLLSALEGVALGSLLLLSVGRIVAQFNKLRQQAFVALALAYAATFVYIFAAIGNFGILTRQRSQVLPLLLVLAALPPAVAKGRGRRAESNVGGTKAAA